MELLYKKTTELTHQEIQNICEVFNTVFIGHTKSISDFKTQFLNTDFGYSYHGLLMKDGVIVGSQTYIPFVYLINDKEVNAALSVDTMILENHRNFDNIFDLWIKGHKLLKEANFAFIFGFPNESAYPLLIKGLKEKDIGDLSTYILPYKIGSLKKQLSFLNIFSILASHLMVSFSVFSKNQSTKHYKISKNREKFNTYRYQWFEGNYQKISMDNFVFYYKIKMHKGIKTAFLIDVSPLSKKNFDQAVRYILKNESKNFDVILYIGHLHFTPISLIKMPKKLEPKTFHFTAKILDKNAIEPELLYNIDNWDVNLSNYDLI